MEVQQLHEKKVVILGVELKQILWIDRRKS